MTGSRRLAARTHPLQEEDLRLIFISERRTPAKPDVLPPKAAVVGLAHSSNSGGDKDRCGLIAYREIGPALSVS